MNSISVGVLEQQAARFQILLGEARYFEAHEALEAIWFERRFEAHDEVRLLRALINAAVSFELVKRGRKKSAQKPWGFYRRHSDLAAKRPAAKRGLYQGLIEVIETIGRELHA